MKTTRRIYLDLTAANEHLSRFGLTLDPATVKAAIRRVYRRNGCYDAPLDIPGAPLDHPVLPYFYSIPIGKFSDVGLYDESHRYIWRVGIEAESGAAVHTGMARSWSKLRIELEVAT